MIQYSIIIPQRDRADDVRRQVPLLAAAMGEMEQPHEVIVIDDGSSPETARAVEHLQSASQNFRLLRLGTAHGASVALSVGIAAARGQVVIAIEPGETYPVTQVPALIDRLSRADLVVGRRRRAGAAKLWARIARIPRALLLGLDAHDPDCLFWVARREAVQGLELARGMARYLPWLVARRGYRVCESYVEHHGATRRLDDLRPNPLDLMAAWWLCRRWGDHEAQEILPHGAQPALRLVGADDAPHAACESRENLHQSEAQSHRAKSA